MILYLDLDGVFADFHTRAREVVGFDLNENIPKAWGKLSRVDNLFLTIEPLPYAKALFDQIMSAGVETKILTAVPRKTGKLVTASQDKVDWVRRHLHPTIEVICSDGWRGKRRHATPFDILVDDMTRNIEDWRDAGGIGVHHTDPEVTLKQLRWLGLSC